MGIREDVRETVKSATKKVIEKVQPDTMFSDDLKVLRGRIEVLESEVIKIKKQFGIK